MKPMSLCVADEPSNPHLVRVGNLLICFSQFTVIIPYRTLYGVKVFTPRAYGGPGVEAFHTPAITLFRFFFSYPYPLIVAVT